MMFAFTIHQATLTARDRGVQTVMSWDFSLTAISHQNTELKSERGANDNKKCITFIHLSLINS